MLLTPLNFSSSLIKENDYVFISLGNEKSKKKPLTPSRYWDEIKKICETIGVTNVSPKNFRRFTNVSLIDSGIDKTYRELWLGHTSEVEDAYDLWSKYPEKIREIYAQAIPYVGIGNCYAKTTQEIEQLKKDMADLKTENTELKAFVKDMRSIYDKFQETFKAQETEITGIKTDSQVLKKQINQMAELMEFVQSQQKPQ